VNTLFCTCAAWFVPSLGMNDAANQPSFMPPTSTVLLLNVPAANSTPPLGRNWRWKLALTSTLWWMVADAGTLRRNASLMLSTSRLYWNFAISGRLWIIHELERNTCVR